MSRPLECRVVDVLGPYVDMLEQAKARATALPKPLNLVVITDGEVSHNVSIMIGLRLVTFFGRLTIQIHLDKNSRF